jgi:hypothetical protein
MKDHKAKQTAKDGYFPYAVDRTEEQIKNMEGRI